MALPLERFCMLDLTRLVPGPMATPNSRCQT
jgi:hypothetical protein